MSYHQTILEIAVSIHYRIDTLLDRRSCEYSKFFDSFCCCCYMVITSSCYKGLVVEPFSLAVLIAILSIVQLPWYFTEMKYSLYLIQTRANEGDLSTMFCCLNTIKHCTSYWPILIIRDVKNLQPQRVHNFFSILESRKESDNIGFPAIVETSDNLWINEMQSDLAKIAFEFYYLNPMSYNDGKKELVDKLS